MKAAFGSTTTIYVENYYEQTGSTIRKYYYANGQRVAMRVGSTLYWLLTDHLGSTAITAYSGGSKKAELRYKAWGETRYTYGTTPTAYKFTGQRLDESTGLYYYGARYYDPALGRFVQADTIVPEPGNPQALNRYSYVLNNPVRYTDPTGHAICLDEECRQLVHPITLQPIGGWDRQPPPPPSVPTPTPLPTPSIWMSWLTPVPTPGPYITTLYGHDANQGQGRSWGPIPFFSGMRTFWAWSIIMSGIEGSVTYYENGAYIVVSDRYDTDYLDAAFMSGLDLSLSRSIGVETTGGEQFGPYSLGTVSPGQVGDTATDPIGVWIPKQAGAPERIWVDLTVQGMAAKGPAIAWASYYVIVPLPYGPWPANAPWFISNR